MFTTRPNQILVGVAADEPIRAALEFTGHEARRRGCDVHVVHVIATGDLTQEPETFEIVHSALRRAGADALSRASHVLRETLGDDHAVTTELTYGPVGPSLAATSEQAVDLVVLQHQRMGAPGWASSRSVTNGVMAHAHAPVVAVPATWHEADSAARVVVGLGDHEDSIDLARSAFEAARARRAPLRLVHAWHFTEAFDDMVFAGAAGEHQHDVVRQALVTRLAPLLEEFEDVDAQIEVSHARAAEALVDESAGAGLLVLGRHHPRTRLGPHLGSVVRAVLRQARCPVMVVDPAWTPSPASPARPVPFRDQQRV